MIAAFGGRATEGAAFAWTSAGAKGILGTALMATTGLTATEGVIDGRPAAGESDNGFNDNGLRDRFGEPNDGTGADGRTGPDRTETPRTTCAAAGEGAARHMTMKAASTRLTSPL